ncbi:MAG: hypothetical protein HZB81_08865 [Deltaproteobacteria bacterium]|nr:hypothetical protein [Deltaproteobacteria bacterium]
MSNVLVDINKLAGIVKTTGEDKVVSSTVKKLIDYKRKEMEAGLERIKKRLKKFEHQYSMTSKGFEKRYIQGELGDDMDFIQWHSTLDMYGKIKKQLEGLDAR